jgi:hypothetical protein
MSMMFLAAMMMSQAPSAAQPVLPAQSVAARPRPKQVCEYEEIVGSHAKKRVCHDADDRDSDAGNNAFGNAKVETIGTAGRGTLASH